MAIVRTIKCDACGKEDVLESFEGKWYNLQTVVANSSSLVKMLRPDGSADPLEREELDNFTDGGDFCSLPCVANWSSAQAGLRELG